VQIAAACFRIDLWTIDSIESRPVHVFISKLAISAIERLPHVIEHCLGIDRRSVFLRVRKEREKQQRQRQTAGLEHSRLHNIAPRLGSINRSYVDSVVDVTQAVTQMFQGRRIGRKSTLSIRFVCQLVMPRYSVVFQRAPLSFE